MPTYAIGDVQGCYDDLCTLLEKIKFDPAKDELWFTGDLVNRGPHSLKTLRLVKSLGNNAVSVLGNHDLHLLAIVFGNHMVKPQDTLADILTAPDKDELCHWLRQQPLLHHQENYVLVHAGIFPDWSLLQAKQYAGELEQALQGDDYAHLLNHLYGDMPHQWDPALSGSQRLRFIINAFTRMRLYGLKHTLELQYKGPPDEASGLFMPWFKAEHRKTKAVKIIFGHWAALACKVDDEPNLYPLDSGCVWGNSLTALRLEDEQRISVPCRAK